MNTDSEKCYHCEDSDSGLFAYDAPDGSEAYICHACHDVERTADHFLSQYDDAPTE